VCSGLAVSPKRCRVALYRYCRPRNLTGLDIETFLRHLLRHLPSPVDLLWGRGPIRRRWNVHTFLAHQRWLDVDNFPAYAPELNPVSDLDRAIPEREPRDPG
jgi:hypothetical protein